MPEVPECVVDVEIVLLRGDLSSFGEDVPNLMSASQLLLEAVI